MPKDDKEVNDDIHLIAVDEMKINKKPFDGKGIELEDSLKWKGNKPL